MNGRTNNLTYSLMTYLFKSLVFALISFLIIKIIITPIVSPIFSILNIISVENEPNFTLNISSIFQPKDTNQSPETSNDIIIVDRDVVPYSSIVYPKYGQHFANFKIESLEIDCNLYLGDSDEILKLGPGQYSGSSLPGFGYPILIAGHNHKHFKPLQHIELGALVEVTTNYGDYVYEVTDIQTIPAEDTSAFDLYAEKEQLILYTCWPFKQYVPKTHRFYVYCEKISGPVVVK